MEFDKVLKSRRSIRTYTQKEVSNDLIKEVIEAGTLAPSAHFREPWRFLVLKNNDKDELVAMLENSKNSKTDKSISKTASIMKEADTIILIFNASKEHPKMDTLSIGACIENMCLKATELNIASLWIGNILYAEEEIKKRYNLEDLELMSALALGYSKQEPKNLERKSVEDVILGQ